MIRLVMLVRQFTEVMRTVLLVLWRWLLVQTVRLVRLVRLVRQWLLVRKVLLVRLVYTAGAERSNAGTAVTADASILLVRRRWLLVRFVLLVWR